MWKLAHHVTFGDVFLAQFESASSTRHIGELAVQDVLRQAIMHPHQANVAQPARRSLPCDGDVVI